MFKYFRSVDRFSGRFTIFYSEISRLFAIRSFSIKLVVGEGLYLLPSDINLRIGTYDGYNNNILIATSDLSLGSNQYTNSTPTVDAFDDQLPVSSPSSDDVNIESVADDQPPPPTDSHADEKNYIIIGIAVIGGLCALIYDLFFR